MEQFVTWFDPQPSDGDRPRLLNSPFDVDAPPPLVRRAAEGVMRHLRAGSIGPGLATSVLHGPDGGKMFGVLVVEAADGRVGFLKSFSGQLLRAWDVEGWVPPVFDRAARSAVEPPGEVAVKSLTARVEAARDAAELAGARAAARELEARHGDAARLLRERHEANRVTRHAERARLRESGLATPEALRALDQLSRADDAELRHAKLAWRAEREAAVAAVKKLERRLAALERLRRIVSQEVSWQLYDTYQFENARGRHVSLRALFAPKIPSSGTGDCAAPKLLVFAQRHRLKPLGLAEFWWGAAPPGGARIEGEYFPACKDKCGPLLPFLLEGVEVAPSRRFKPPDLSREELPIVFEDERLVVVNKPEGLLSVPGTDATVTDSVLARMRARFPAATGPLLVHRLDLETSGLLVVALDADAHTALQRQFIEREVEKRYVAVLDGLITEERGVIELPLRVDLEQRPRQVVDFEHGKPATTEFTVLERTGGRTRVAFFPKTGRTHQLRVHASHARGLGTPIVGDRLYGRPERRLMLHAEALTLRHSDGRVLTLHAPAPF